MKELKGKEYIRFESIKHTREDGSEYWSARELGPALEYSKWENFHNVIKRAMIACDNSGHSISNDFPGVRKIVEARTVIEKIGGTMPEDLPTPEKSIQQIEKEQMARLREKAKKGKIMLDE